MTLFEGFNQVAGNKYNADVNEVLPNLFVGNARISQNPNFIHKNNITLIVNCTRDIPFIEWVPCKIRLAINDNPNESNQFFLNIDQVVNYIYTHVTQNKGVLVHCRAGVQRSASVIVAFLLKYANMDLAEAVAYVKNKRNQVFYGGINFCEGLKNYENVLNEISPLPPKKTKPKSLKDKLIRSFTH